jgi:hypothetical protein
VGNAQAAAPLAVVCARRASLAGLRTVGLISEIHPTLDGDRFNSTTFPIAAKPSTTTQLRRPPKNQDSYTTIIHAVAEMADNVPGISRSNSDIGARGHHTCTTGQSLSRTVIKHNQARLQFHNAAAR